MRVIGYTRVSTDEQALSGYGLEHQAHELRKACTDRGWLLVDMLSEGVSGKSLERPQLHRALELIAAGEAEGLIVAKLDRLSRSVIDFANLFDWFQRADKQLVILDLNIDTSTASGKMTAQLFAVLAEWERDTISERTKGALRAARARGKPISRASVHDQPELAHYIRRLREQEWTYAQICELLNLQGVPTLRGGSCWRPSAVVSVLGYRRRPRPRGSIALPDV